MARKRANSEEGGGDSWLNTYADMVTLLLTFFAVMLSMSSVDQEKFNAFIKAFSVLPEETIEEIVAGNNSIEDINGDIIAVSGLNELYLSLKEYVEENNQGDAVKISADEDIVYISFSSSIFFRPDQYDLLPESLPIRSFIGDGLKENEDKIRSISVCGHTADIGGYGYSEESEWFLSTARASSVVEYLIKDKKFDDNKLIPLGYGGTRPIAKNNTEEGQKKNRRVELVIVGNSSKVNFDLIDPTGRLKPAKNPADSQTPKDKAETSVNTETSVNAETSVNTETSANTETSVNIEVSQMEEKTGGASSASGGETNPYDK